MRTEIGIEMWLAKDDQLRVGHAENTQRQHQFFELLLDYRAKLKSVYTGAENDDIKRRRKKQLMRLKVDWWIMSEKHMK